MKDYSDYVGKTFERLTILSLTDDYVSPHGVHQPMVICRCNCGKTKRFNLQNIIKGKTKSCGCYAKEALRNKADTSIYSRRNNKRLCQIHDNMISRCYNKKTSNYERYGGRGIFISDMWLGKNGLRNFVKWSLENGYSDELTIDRIDNNKGYSPENCRWVTYLVQGNNTRRNKYVIYNGEKKSYAQWAKILGLKSGDTIKNRIESGWPIELAVTLSRVKPHDVMKHLKKDENCYLIAQKRINEAIIRKSSEIQFEL